MDIEKKIKSILKDLTKDYDAKVSYDFPGKEQEYARVNVSDPNRTGLSFAVAFNRDGDPVSLELTDFTNNWINDWEGFSAEDILKIASSIMVGNISHTNSILLPKVSIKYGQDKVVSARRLLRNNRKISGYARI